MKVQGVEDINAVLARVRKLHALGRIAREDKEFIEQRLEEASARVVAMQETDEDGKEI